MLYKLGACCDDIIYVLIQPPSFMLPSMGLCCAPYLRCCLQQTFLEFCTDLISFHSGHMCLEDNLKLASHLMISELLHFWTRCEFALDFGWHIILSHIGRWSCKTTSSQGTSFVSVTSMHRLFRNNTTPFWVAKLP